MRRDDRLHALAGELWGKAMLDGDYSFKPFAIRIDVGGWKLLLNSRAAYDDKSFDRFEHPDKYRWRGLERIMVYQPVEAVLRDVNAVAGGPVDQENPVCEMLCIEARQPGENGRRKYYDATPEQLEEAMGDG